MVMEYAYPKTAMSALRALDNMVKRLCTYWSYSLFLTFMHVGFEGIISLIRLPSAHGEILSQCGGVSLVV